MEDAALTGRGNHRRILFLNGGVNGDAGVAFRRFRSENTLRISVNIRNISGFTRTVINITPCSLLPYAPTVLLNMHPQKCGPASLCS
jgi:hypothetical protein